MCFSRLGIPCSHSLSVCLPHSHSLTVCLPDSHSLFPSVCPSVSLPPPALPLFRLPWLPLSLAPSLVSLSHSLTLTASLPQYLNFLIHIRQKPLEHFDGPGIHSQQSSCVSLCLCVCLYMCPCMCFYVFPFMYPHMRMGTDMRMTVVKTKSVPFATVLMCVLIYVSLYVPLSVFLRAIWPHARKCFMKKKKRGLLVPWWPVVATYQDT